MKTGTKWWYVTIWDAGHYGITPESHRTKPEVIRHDGDTKPAWSRVRPTPSDYRTSFVLQAESPVEALALAIGADAMRKSNAIQAQAKAEAVHA